MPIAFMYVCDMHDYVLSSLKIVRNAIFIQIEVHYTLKEHGVFLLFSYVTVHMTPCVSNRATGCVPLRLFKTFLSVNGNYQLVPPFSTSLSLPNECCPMERFCCSVENVQSRGGDG